MISQFAIRLTKVFFYYLLLFAFCRLLFLFYFYPEITVNGVSFLPLALYHAIPLDISTSSYLLFIPSLLTLVFLLTGKKYLNQLLTLYLLLTSFVFVFLSIAEIGVYREVHVKIYFNLLTHLKHADELFHSASISLLLTIFSLIAVVFYGCNKLIRYLLYDRFERAQYLNLKNGLSLFGVYCLFTTLLVLGCRGGLRPIPINEGEVYFSNNQCVNDAAVNPLWNIVHSYIETCKVLRGNAYKVMKDDVAKQIVRQLFAADQDTTVTLFKIKRPNICFIILESWSADVIASLGGYEGLTPSFEKLIQQGYVFTDVKPTGHVSDQGIPGILSGYPALPIGSAINQPDKYPKLPCLNNQLKEAGYYSSFFFGGQLIYGNIKSYIYYNKFDRVMEQADFPVSIPSGRLGIHDSAMLSIWRDSLNRMPQPFFSCLFTLSTHSPFDATTDRPVKWGTKEDSYLNSVVYSDRQLGKFFEQVKEQTWYDSTVFFLVADHSHNVPKNFQHWSPEFYHIPLLICGGALKEEYRGKRYTETASQLDIASTLLHQLDMPATSYNWSKNLMNPNARRFAFYTFNEGFGFCSSGRAVVWNKRTAATESSTIDPQLVNDSMYIQGAAMLQVLMQDFLER
ncbi:MAG: sulfatase-like hydrolase/transferase [Chitinophagales bacterium]